MKKVSCANCGRTSWLVASTPGAYWCASEEAFVCFRCGKARKRGERASCPHCHGRLQPRLNLALALCVISLAGLLIFAALETAELPTRLSLQDMSWATSPLAGSATVKIHGTILGGAGTVVLMGQWESIGKAGHYVWSGVSFNLGFGSGTVWIAIGDVINSQSVYSAPHSINSGNEEEYIVGDQVTVVGQVGYQNGTPFVNALDIAPYPYSFLNLDWLGPALVGWGLLAFVGALFLYGVPILRSRAKKMEAKWTTGLPWQEPGTVDARAYASKVEGAGTSSGEGSHLRCSLCSWPVSDSDTACPKCGAPFR